MNIFIIWTAPSEAGSNPLDGCVYLYLDMGTNIGVQIRKLFEHQKFPDAAINEIFQKYFFSNNNTDIDNLESQICAVGWEPNPLHTAYLRELERSYHRCGYRVTIFTGTGVGVKQDNLTFASVDTDPVAYSYFPMQVASHFTTEEEMKENNYYRESQTTTVPVIRIADFINKVVATRALPENKSGVVVMKLDVEGMEAPIVADLMMSGALAHIDNLHMDWELATRVETGDDEITIDSIGNKRNYNFRKYLMKLQDIIKDLNLTRMTEFANLDDESYQTFKGGFPAC